MNAEELIKKLDRARDDLRDGFQTNEDYIQFLEDVFDGNKEWALGDDGPFRDARDTDLPVRKP